jgi:hypothetical protein
MSIFNGIKYRPLCIPCQFQYRSPVVYLLARCRYSSSNLKLDPCSEISDLTRDTGIAVTVLKNLSQLPVPLSFFKNCMCTEITNI